MLRRRMIKKRRPRKTQKTRKKTVPRTPSAKHTPLDLPGFKNQKGLPFDFFPAWLILFP